MPVRQVLAPALLLLPLAVLGMVTLASPSGLVSASLPAPTPIVREFPVTTNPAWQGSPAIGGNVVVWQDHRNGNSDIYGKNLTTGTEFPIVTNPAGQWYPAIEGNLALWEDNRSGNWDIFAKNLATGVELPIVTNRANQYNPARSGNVVVWTDTRNGNPDIYGKDLSTGVEFPITIDPAHQLGSAIDGDIVVWRDYRNDPDGQCDRLSCRSDVYAKNLADGVEFPVAANAAPYWGRAISGNLVIWQDSRNGNPDVYGKNLATGVEFAIVTHTAPQYSPAISGDIVVWGDGRNGNLDIYGKNLATGVEFTVVTNLATQGAFAISGNVVVWEDWRNGDIDIYGARLEWPPGPSACSITGTVRDEFGSYYLEEAGRVVAFLYGASVNFPAYLGQRVAVGGPCRVWREAMGPRPVFLAETIQLAGNQGGKPPTKEPRGATRGW